MSASIEWVMTASNPETKPKSKKKKRSRGVQAEYNKMIEQWGREVANEIMLKRARSGRYDGSPKPKKKGPDLLDAHWARASGSYEGGRKR